MNRLLLLIHFCKREELGDFNLKQLQENEHKIQFVFIFFLFELLTLFGGKICGRGNDIFLFAKCQVLHDVLYKQNALKML